MSKASMRLSTDSDLSLLLTPESYLFKIVQGQFLTKSNSTEKWRERCSTAILRHNISTININNKNNTTTLAR